MFILCASLDKITIMYAQLAQRQTEHAARILISF